MSEAPQKLRYGLVAVALLAAISLAVPRSGNCCAARPGPIIRRAGAGVAGVVRQPEKLALLVGGSVLVTTSYIVAIYLATQAFGAELSIAQVGAVYMAAATIASAAPTPGGLGALEAALVAGLAAAGLPNGGGAVGVPVPARHLLAADPPRLAELPLAPTRRLPLAAASVDQRSQRRF